MKKKKIYLSKEKCRHKKYIIINYNWKHILPQPCLSYLDKFLLTSGLNRHTMQRCDRLMRVCVSVLVHLSSYLPWFEIYYKLLNTLADYLTKHQVIRSISLQPLTRMYVKLFYAERRALNGAGGDGGGGEGGGCGGNQKNNNTNPCMIWLSYMNTQHCGTDSVYCGKMFFGILFSPL